MPWHITKSAQCPASKPWAVIKDADGTVEGCHTSQTKAHKQMAALYASEPGGMMSNNSEPLPTDNLVRAIFPGQVELRDAGESGMPTMEVGFAVYDEWTEINSSFEGNFMERVAPGAFTKTIKENLPNMRALFQHGRDPQIGDKVLGPISEVVDGERGPKGIVPLLDTSYNRDLIPGLRAGVYGSSFRFRVLKEQVDRDAEPSDWNPKGLPERTIQEAAVSEFGPVTWPAYSSATAGIRSLTDEFLPGGRYAQGPDGYAERVETPEQQFAEIRDELEATTTVEEEPPHSEVVDEIHDHVSRDTPPAEEVAPTNEHDRKVKEMHDTIAEMRARQDEILSELKEIAAENNGRVLSAADQARYDQLKAEHKQLGEAAGATEQREQELREMAGDPAHREEPVSRDTGTYLTRREGRDKTPENPFDVAAYHGYARDQQHMLRLVGDGAKRAIETFRYPHPDADRAKVNAHIEQVLRNDSPDKEIALRILNCGSELYHRAFWKYITSQSMTTEEQRALAVGAVGTGGAAVPIDLDPTLIPTSNGVLNPLREISRVFTTTSYQWNGVTSGGVTAQYRAEGAGMSDNSPTLTQPAIYPERADVLVPFSWELGQDWASLESSLAVEIQDAKDTLEATKFALGAGHASSEPQGVWAAAATVYPTVSVSTLTSQDFYNIYNQLPPRAQPNATWVVHPTTYGRISTLDVYGGGNFWRNLGQGDPDRLIGQPIRKLSTIGTAYVTSSKWGIVGDFNRFAIVDRIGMSMRTIPDLFVATANTAYPTGQSGLVAFWRNSSGMLDSNAFRVGTIGQA